MSLSNFLGCVTNQRGYTIPQVWPDGGKNSVYSVCGDLEEADWSEVEALAKAKGVKVTFDGGVVEMEKGKSNGRFAANVAGLKNAQQFLEGVR